MSPLQQLIATKSELRHQAREQQQQVSEQWRALRENSGRLILSGVSDMFFPHRKKHHHPKNKEEKSHFWQEVTDNLPFYLTIVHEGLSVSWYLIRPFYLRWLMHHKK